MSTAIAVQNTIETIYILVVFQLIVIMYINV